MMNRRAFVGAAAGGFVAVPFATFAQQRPAKVPQIGWLSPGSSKSDEKFLTSFRDGLRELGWVSEQDIAIESRWAEGKFERLPGLAAELVQLKVDVIVAVVTQASLAAKHATQTIPRA